MPRTGQKVCGGWVLVETNFSVDKYGRALEHSEQEENVCPLA